VTKRWGDKKSARANETVPLRASVSKFGMESVVGVRKKSRIKGKIENLSAFTAEDRYFVRLGVFHVVGHPENL
jgi:hypothetical protein